MITSYMYRPAEIFAVLAEVMDTVISPVAVFETLTLKLVAHDE